MKRTKLLLGLVLWALAAVLSADPLEITFGSRIATDTDGSYENGFYDDTFLSFGYAPKPFDFHLDFAYLNDEKYRPHSSYQWGHYFFINDAYAAFDWNGLSFKGGFTPHYDVVESPYAIYINSLGEPALNADVTYEDDLFFYKSHWVRLNEHSNVRYIGNGNVSSGQDFDGDGTIDAADTYRDRGMTFKAYGLKLGDLTVGFEDAYLYLDRAFDFESFMLPVPMYLVEMFRTTPGRPWSEELNPNSLMGFFGTWERDDWYVEGQILIDDINAGFLAPALGWMIPSLNTINNLTKMSWSLGGHWDGPWGKIGFYHGGATKYCYEDTYSYNGFVSSMPYPYYYYPATEYAIDGSGNLAEIPYSENAIGYKYGENSLAFCLTFEDTFFEEEPWAIHLDSSLEWAINGAKSPANPWHEYTHWSEIEPSVELLNDPVLEHLLVAQAGLTSHWNHFIFSLGFTLGYAWNQLELEELVAGEPKIFVPQEGNDGFIGSISLGVAYQWDITAVEE